MTERHSCDVAVIGAGAVGLAIARALAQAGLETVILERGRRIGGETSSRNSEVIHAGLYYAPGSLKTRLCIAGRQKLYAFAGSHGIAHNKLGKWLVANGPEQEVRLAAILSAAPANGVHDLAPVSAQRARAEEPDLRSSAIVESPSTGIIDSHAYMLALLGDAEDRGARIAYDADVKTLARVNGYWRLCVHNNGDVMELDADRVVNSAGLWAQGVARATQGLDVTHVPPLHLVKGSYARFGGRIPFRRLIYPMPDPGGLGVHLTLDMAGQARFGPDVEWLDHNDPARIDYAVRPDIAADFAERIRNWWPGVEVGRLSPAYSGVRPKYTRAGELAGDFRIDGPDMHGLPGLVNLFGIESPGLTASLAIADHVAEQLR